MTDKKVTLPLAVRPMPKHEEEEIPLLISHLKGLLGQWQGHRASTIEHVWKQANENFEGLFDDDSIPSGKHSKLWRSKAFYALTEQKVMAAQSQLQDILFKGGGFPFDVKNSPISDSGIQDKIMPMDEQGTQDPEIQAKADRNNVERQKIKRMKRYMSDQLAECDASSVGLMGIFYGALYGTSFFESPKVVRRRRHKWTSGKDGKFTKKVVYEDYPTVINLNPWDCWPDPECEGKVENGIGFFHRSRMSLPDLQNLYALVFPSQEIETADAGSEEYEYEYFKKGFDALLEEAKEMKGNREGSSTSNGPSAAEATGSVTKTFDVFTFSGAVQNKFLKKFMPDLKEDDHLHTEAIITFSGDHVIKAVRNPFSGERRPYHMVPWTKVPGSAYGRGVAQKIFDPQKNVNRLLRMYIDNKRLSGNLMTAIDKNKLAKGSSMEIYPGKNWEFEAGYTEGDVGKVMQPVFLPDVTAGVLDAINTIVAWADQSSGIPRILEGGGGGGGSSTAFEENQKMMSAAKQLGLVLKNFDNHAWVPIVESFYDWNMEFSKDEEIKGDFSIIATGFATFENRNIRKLDLERLLMMSQQLPALQQKVKADPIMEDWAVAGNIDPERYMLTEEEVSNSIKQNQQQQMEMQAAMMQLEQQKEMAKHQMELEKIKFENDASGMIRSGLAQINSQTKLASDQLKSETQKLIKLADIESKESKDGREGTGRGTPTT